MCVGHPAEKLDQIDETVGLRRPTSGIYRIAQTNSQNVIPTATPDCGGSKLYGVNVVKNGVKPAKNYCDSR